MSFKGPFASASDLAVIGPWVGHVHTGLMYCLGTCYLVTAASIMPESQQEVLIIRTKKVVLILTLKLLYVF